LFCFTIFYKFSFVEAGNERTVYVALSRSVYVHAGALQTSLKFTAEPPQGVKAGLKRTYGIITQDQLDISNMPQWKPLLYDVAFLHTTLQVGHPVPDSV